MAQENLKPLKILVFSMGLLLLGGTVLLMGLVWKKVAAGEAGAALSAGCPGGNVDLKGRGSIVDSTMEGRSMRVLLEKGDNHRELVTIDMCSGKVVSALAIESDPAPTAE